MYKYLKFTYNHLFYIAIGNNTSNFYNNTLHPSVRNTINYIKILIYQNTFIKVLDTKILLLQKKIRVGKKNIMIISTKFSKFVSNKKITIISAKNHLQEIPYQFFSFLV